MTQGSSCSSSVNQTSNCIVYNITILHHSSIVHIVHIAQLQFIVHIYQYCTILPDIVREIQVALDRHGDDDQLGIRVRVPPGSAAAANDHDAEAGVYYGTSRT